jgi:hypothetical protein
MTDRMITYPIELLPRLDDDEEAEIFVCENHHDKEGPCPNCKPVAALTGKE